MKRGSNEHGQAVVEALLMLPLMAVLLWAVSDIGAMQFSAQRTTQVSRQAVMASALGQPAATLRAPARMDLEGSAQSWPGFSGAGVRALQDEWFGGAMRLLSVQVRSLPPAVNVMFGLPVSRQLSVASGAGYAHGDADAQRRIGASPTGWLQSSRTSLAEARRMQRFVNRAEAPWGRPALSRDWLSAWGDVVPGDRLGKRAEGGR
ncbi:pilus assembly protein TadE [Achromobacter mucicolens]|uniref:TadE/TadG family type IV pilus assembly protein n=1 Tax=Achromobacter mucicolens TaxID=1389922 RepID=UPI000D363903|nr:pilus assembly protein [Achromobacter mucicolens]PTW97637.1 pilus assembly protein TadE [Achromobacter mucicolens]